MPLWIWLSFVAFISALVFIDLVVLHRDAHSISLKEALGWTSVWVTVALMFNVLVYFLYEGRLGGWRPESDLSGKDAALEFLTAYVVEYTLSVDNIFVIAMIISAFHVPSKYQHRLLFWGVLGAALLRGVMIWLGSALIHKYEWIIYVFGGLLILSALKMIFSKSEEIDPEKNLLVRLTRKIYPVTSEFDGQHFFTKINGKRMATPMLLALVLIESCDVVFAVDSIPAVFAVTRDPFIVFTSNIFAILGLRSLYFALAGLMDVFTHLKTAMIVLLFFVGIKMLMSQHYKLPNLVSLGIIGSILATGVIASLYSGKHDPELPHPPTPEHDVPPGEDHYP